MNSNIQALDRLNTNVNNLRQTQSQTTKGEQIQGSASEQVQNIAREIVRDSAAIAAQTNLPENLAVENFTRSYRESSGSQPVTTK